MGTLCDLGKRSTRDVTHITVTVVKMRPPVPLKQLASGNVKYLASCPATSTAEVPQGKSGPGQPPGNSGPPGTTSGSTTLGGSPVPTLSLVRPDGTAKVLAEAPHNGDYGVVLAFPAPRPRPLPEPVATLLAEFLGGYRGNTRDAYRRDLTDYLTYAVRAGLDPLTARRTDLTRYLTDCEDRALSPATIARRLTAISGWYRYCVEEAHLTASPAQHLRYRRPRSQTRIVSLTRAQLNAFLRAADTHCPRTGALAWLLAITGLRISEACNARREDLHHSSDGLWLDVTCKGGLRRSIPILPPIQERLERLHSEDGIGPLFPTSAGRPLDRRNAARILARTAQRAGIRGPFSPHVLRHTFVTLARADGCPLEDVQDAAGHADPATTRRYDRTIVGSQHHPGHALISSLATEST